MPGSLVMACFQELQEAEQALSSYFSKPLSTSVLSLSAPNEASCKRFTEEVARVFDEFEKKLKQVERMHAAKDMEA